MDSVPKSPTPRETAEAAERLREKEVREAVERVYRKYGTDLAAFNRDVQKELELVKRG